MDYVGPQDDHSHGHDDHGHGDRKRYFNCSPMSWQDTDVCIDHSYEEPKTFADYIKPEYYYR